MNRCIIIKKIIKNIRNYLKDISKNIINASLNTLNLLIKSLQMKHYRNILT